MATAIVWPSRRAGRPQRDCVAARRGRRRRGRGRRRGATGSRRLAALSAALTWVWPYAVVWNSVHERVPRGRRGLRPGARVLRPADPPDPTEPVDLRGARAGRRRRVVGVARDRLLRRARRRSCSWPRGTRLWAPPGRLGDAGARPARWCWPPPGRWSVPCRGSTPTSVGGFASLRPGPLPSSDGIGYGGRLAVFFHDMLPVQLGVRAVPGGAWVGGPVVGAGALRAVRRPGRGRRGWSILSGRAAGPRRRADVAAAAAGVMVFPFLAAAFPSSSYWSTAATASCCRALVVVLLALALAGPPLDPRPPRSASDRGRALRLTGGDDPLQPGPAAPAARWARGRCSWPRSPWCWPARPRWPPPHGPAGCRSRPRAFVAGWGDPEAPARHVMARLEAEHLPHAYGDYWTAYVLDFLDPGRVGGQPSPPRRGALARRPRRGAPPRPARPGSSSPPAGRGEAAQAFANPETGPGNYTEAGFSGPAARRGASPTVSCHLGVLDAVVPAGPVAVVPPPG